MGAMVSSFRRAVVGWTEQTLHADLSVEAVPPPGGLPAGGLHPEVLRRVLERFGPRNVDPYRSSDAWIDGERVNLAGADLAVAAREEGIPFLGGRAAADVYRDVLANGGMVVNEPFARRFDAWRGDVVTLQTPAGPIGRRVAGVFRDYVDHTGRAVLDSADFLGSYPDEGPQSIAVFLPAGADLEAERAGLARALEGEFTVRVLSNAELKSGVLAVFDRTFAITIALRIVASIVAAIAVVVVLGALVQERRRELAVVRAIGGSKRHVFGVVVTEAALLGAAGAAGGLAVGLAVGWILVAVVQVQSFGWSIPFAPSVHGLVVTAGAVLPACLLAGALPAWAAWRASPREALADA